MADIVFAAGAPHAPGLIGLLDAAPADVQDVVATTYRSLSQEIRAAKPDALIVFANDHLANSRVRDYPDFLIGLAEEHTGPFEWFKPWIGCDDYRVKGDRWLAERLFDGMNRRGVRMSASHENLKFDDNISVPVLLTQLNDSSIPVIPVLQNCTVPPIPDQRQCYKVGQALADFIRKDLPADMRIALLGSGGLSHEPGGARYYFIDEEFDRWFIELAASGDHDRLLNELTIERMERSGAGGTCELLAWLVVLGAVGPRKGKSFGYTVHREFKCGVGAVLWDLSQPAAAGTQVYRSVAVFDPSLSTHDLIQDLKWDRDLRAQFGTDEASVLDRYNLRPEERKAIEKRDFRALYDMGLHAYLGGQFARLIYGNDAGKGAKIAVDKLVESLTGGNPH